MGKRWWLWGAFIVVHVAVSWLVETAQGLPQGDLSLVYQPWAEQALSGGPVVGIDRPWVYPVLALLPMLLAASFGPDLYVTCWLVLVTALDAAAFQLLVGRATSRRRVVAAWWWLAFVAALGPIAFARIDAITVPLAVAALLLVLRHPRTGTVLLAIVTWMKVWPAALLGAIVVASRHRWLVVAIGAATSVAIFLVALVFGSGLNVLSFITEQAGRGLQIESPVSTVYMWLAAAGVGGAYVYYDREILTFQVTGPGADTTIAAMTPLLIVAIGGTVVFAWTKLRGGAPFARLFPPLSLALVSALILFNKVGSPQFATWLIAPVVFGLVVGGVRRYGLVAIVALIIAALTQTIYPYLYGWLLVPAPAMVSVLTVRNLAWVALFVISLVGVHRSTRTSPAMLSRRILEGDHGGPPRRMDVRTGE